MEVAAAKRFAPWRLHYSGGSVRMMIIARRQHLLLLLLRNHATIAPINTPATTPRR